MALTTQTAYERIRAYFSKPDAIYGYDTDNQTCVYRGREGRRIAKCAVGCLIPPALYNPLMEGGGINGLLVDETLAHRVTPGLIEYFKYVDSNFLQQAQGEHDDCANREDPMHEFIYELDKLAKRKGLKVV